MIKLNDDTINYILYLYPTTGQMTIIEQNANRTVGYYLFDNTMKNFNELAIWVNNLTISMSYQRVHLGEDEFGYAVERRMLDWLLCNYCFMYRRERKR